MLQQLKAEALLLASAFEQRQNSKHKHCSGQRAKKCFETNLNLTSFYVWCNAEFVYIAD